MNKPHVRALFVSAFVVAAGASVAAAAASPEATPQDVERALASTDAKAQVSALLLRCDDEEGAGTSLCDKIATGDKTWLELAARLREFTDGASSVYVCSSIALAVQRTPVAALQLFGRTPSLNRECICLPFVSDEIPLADQYREVRQSYRAIASVHEPALAVPRASCLAYIEPVMKKLRTDLANARKR